MKSAWRRSVLAPVAAAVLPAYLAACFHYVAVDSGWTPSRGSSIRATLADPIPFNFGTLTLHDVKSVEGTVVDTYPDSLGVWVKWLHPLVGEKYDANSVEFYLRRASITQMEQWRPSGKQTVLLVAVSVGVVAGLLSLVTLATKGGSDVGSPPPDNTSVVGPR